MCSDLKSRVGLMTPPALLCREHNRTSTIENARAYIYKGLQLSLSIFLKMVDISIGKGGTHFRTRSKGRRVTERVGVRILYCLRISRHVSLWFIRFEEDAQQIVSRHIKLLHRYNEAKDATQVRLYALPSNDGPHQLTLGPRR